MMRADAARREKTRQYLAAGSVMIMPAVFVVSWLQWREQLPDILPTHWSGVGLPDGFTDTVVYTAVLAAILTAATIIGLVASMSRRWPAGTERFWLAGAGAVQGMAVSLWAVSAVVTISYGDPEAARLGGWLLLVLLAIGWGAVPALLHPKAPAPRTRVDEPATGADVPAEPWSDTVSSPLMTSFAAATGIIGAIILVPFAVAGDAWMIALAIMLLVTALPILMLARYRVSIDETGLRVSSALLGLPVKRLSLAEIERAGAADIVPAHWGGWGWRFAPGRSAVVLRRGLGLMVRDVHGKEFAVTLPTAGAAAAVLNSYLSGAEARRG